MLPNSPLEGRELTDNSREARVCPQSRCGRRPHVRDLVGVNHADDPARWLLLVVVKQHRTLEGAWVLGRQRSNRSTTEETTWNGKADESAEVASVCPYFNGPDLRRLPSDHGTRPPEVRVVNATRPTSSIIKWGVECGEGEPHDSSSPLPHRSLPIGFSMLACRYRL